MFYLFKYINMDYNEHDQSLHNKHNLLSLAKNMTKSKLISMNLLKRNPTSQISLKKQNNQSQCNTNGNINSNSNNNSNQNNSNLLYSDIITTKERSRSVNQMMSTLLKQTTMFTESTSSTTSNTKLSSKNLNTLITTNNDTCSNNHSNSNSNSNVTSRLPTCSNYNIDTFSEGTPSQTHETESTHSYDHDNNIQHNPIITNRTYNNNITYTDNNIPQQTQQHLLTDITPTTTVTPTTYTIIQLEDIILLEEKLSHIYESFKQSSPNHKYCLEWWTFYTYSDFSSKLETLFHNNTQSKQIIHDTSVLELLSIILIYELLKDTKLPQNIFNNMKNLLNEIHQSFLITSDLILTRIINQSLTNIWINKLQNIILSKRTIRIYKNEHLLKLKKKNEYIINIIKNILRLPSISSTHKADLSTINFYFKKLQTTSIQSLNNYFRKKIIQEYKKRKESISFIIADNKSMPNISVPYLQKKNNDERYFTLVLDLDETLISFKREDADTGILKLRPGLDEFLKGMKPLYELIVFTAGTQDYADPILDAIEKEEKFFEKRLYRQHAVIIENLFVKDLSKLGRDLSKVIIIDNMPHNFRLQKDNGIYIKNFYGEDKSDTTLFDLIPILKDIASDKNNDVRKELKRKQGEIFSKITTDMK